MTPNDVLDSAMRTLFEIGKETGARTSDDEFQKVCQDYTNACDQNEALNKENEILKNRIYDLEHEQVNVQFFRTKRYGEHTHADHIQEVIDSYETRMDELTTRCDELYAENTKLSVRVEELTEENSMLKDKASEEYHNCPTTAKKPDYLTTKMDYESIRKRLKEFEKDNILTQQYLKDSANFTTGIADVPIQFAPGTYVRGDMNDGDTFLGIVKECGIDYIEFFAFFKQGAGQKTTLIHCDDYPENTILFRSTAQIVRVCTHTPTIVAKDIAFVGAVEDTFAEKLDKILARHGFKWDGTKILSNQWE